MLFLWKVFLYETKVTDALRLQTWDAVIAVCDVAPMRFKLIPRSKVGCQEESLNPGTR